MLVKTWTRPPYLGGAFRESPRIQGGFLQRGWFLLVIQVSQYYHHRYYHHHHHHHIIAHPHTHTHIQTHTHAPKYLLGSGARPHPVDGHAHLVTCALATYPPKTSQSHRRTPESPFRNKVAQLSTVPGKCKNGILKSFQLIIFSFVAEQKLTFKMNFPPDMGNIV